MLETPESDGLFVYEYALAAKNRKDDDKDDKQFMKDLRKLLIGFRKKVGNTNKKDVVKVCHYLLNPISN
jgi:hypothetical protein